ncbi:MAG TPA: TIGR03960 family B12-binding radical SAM protein, partial [Desulfobulbaceae bacterium]|nr:TIGR03960 family B12-binding radical SAM protein [Desulfobulbaceae bacterium]
MPDSFSVDIHTILPLVKKPGRYLGGELNTVNKQWDLVELRFCFVFPDLYEIGMSHQGLQILYHIINREDRFLAQRCYAPDMDMETELRKADLPLFALESRRPLSAFDVLGFTLPYELCYTNILTVLDLAGLPLRACERDERHPLVIGGGSCGLNPEPVADFFDAIVLGDGEEVIIELGDCLIAAKKRGLGKKETRQRLARIDGVYVPSFFKPIYKGGAFSGMQCLEPGYDRVHRRILPELPETTVLAKPIVPIVKPVHDRLGIEIARGCTRGCRFCQAGMIYRPVRERNVEDILQLAEQGIAASGFDELALLSLSTGDYSCLPEVLIRLMNQFVDEYVSVSMPSMRVGTLTREIIEQIKRVRKTGFTVAPEAGTDRLREVINKGITEEDLLFTCRDAFGAGWNLIKFYFMIGLPTETEKDVDAIVELAKKARAQAGGKGRVQIN